MKKTTFAFLFTCMIVCLSSCKKKDAADAPETVNGKVLALGHGGMGNTNFYPMNTYEAIVNCINMGANGSEMDVQMTKDSVLVLYHDNGLETLTDGSGPIIDYTWNDLQQYHYQAGPYVQYDIASIDVLFEHIDNLQQHTFSFDNKLLFDDSLRPVFMRAVIRLLEKYQMEENVFIESHDAAFLTAFKLLKSYKYFLNPTDFETGFQQAKDNNIYGIIMDNENISADEISLAHQNGLHVQTWGPASEADNKEAIAKNPDAIQTDNVNALVNLLSD